jgi:hypothetical protein
VARYIEAFAPGTLNVSLVPDLRAYLR